MFKKGDPVMYSRKWLQSTGQYTGPVPFARGTVESIASYRLNHEEARHLVKVKWTHFKGNAYTTDVLAAWPDTVLSVNLARADKPEID